MLPHVVEPKTLNISPWKTEAGGDIPTLSTYDRDIVYRLVWKSIVNQGMFGSLDRMEGDLSMGLMGGIEWDLTS